MVNGQVQAIALFMVSARAATVTTLILIALHYLFT